MRTLLLVASFLTLIFLSSFAAAYSEVYLEVRGTYAFCQSFCSGGDGRKDYRTSCSKLEYENDSYGSLISIVSTNCPWSDTCHPGEAHEESGQCTTDSDGDGEPDSEDADDDNDGDPDESDPHPNDPDCSSDSFDQFKCPGPDQDGNPDNNEDGGDEDEGENNPDPDNDPDPDPDPDPGTDPDEDPEPNNPDPNGGGGSNNDDDDEGSSDDDGNGGGSNGGGGGGGGGNNNGPSTPDAPPRIICPDGSVSDDQQRCPPSDPHHGPGPHPDGDDQICEDGYPPLAGTCDRPAPNNFCPDGTPRWPGTVCKSDPDNDDPNPPENPPPDDYNPRPIPPDGDGPGDVNPDPTPGTDPGTNPGPSPNPGGPVDPDHSPDPDSPPNPGPGDDDSSGEDGDDVGGDDGDETGGEGEGADSLGRSCEAEPPCEGNDPVMCGIQLQTWKLRCQAEGAEGGDCSEASEPQCMDGTIHCEMLKQQHKLLCGEEVTLEDFKQAFKGAGITDDEELIDNYLKEKRTVDNESKLKGILDSLRPPGMGGRTLGDQCYPIPPIVVFGSTIDIDIKYICKLLEVISMLMYLAAYIAAFHILFKSITEE